MQGMMSVGKDHTDALRRCLCGVLDGSSSLSDMIPRISRHMASIRATGGPSSLVEALSDFLSQSGSSEEANRLAVLVAGEQRRAGTGPTAGYIWSNRGLGNGLLFDSHA